MLNIFLLNVTFAPVPQIDAMDIIDVLFPGNDYPILDVGDMLIKLRIILRTALSVIFLGRILVYYCLLA